MERYGFARLKTVTIEVNSTHNLAIQLDKNNFVPNFHFEFKIWVWIKVKLARREKQMDLQPH